LQEVYYINALTNKGIARQRPLNNQGLALQSLGDLQAELSQQQDAINTWQSALAAFTRCLEVAPSDGENALALARR